MGVSPVILGEQEVLLSTLGHGAGAHSHTSQLLQDTGQGPHLCVPLPLAPRSRWRESKGPSLYSPPLIVPWQLFTCWEFGYNEAPQDKGSLFVPGPISGE